MVYAYCRIKPASTGYACWHAIFSMINEYAEAEYLLGRDGQFTAIEIASGVVALSPHLEFDFRSVDRLGGWSFLGELWFQ